MNSGLAFVSIIILIFSVLMTFLTIFLVDELSKEEFRSIRRMIVLTIFLGYLANFLSCIITRGDSALSVAKVAARFKWYGIFGVILLIIGMAFIIYLGAYLDPAYFTYVTHGFLLVLYYIAAVILAFVLSGFFKTAAKEAGAYDTPETAYEEEGPEDIAEQYSGEQEDEEDGSSIVLSTLQSIREQAGQ